MDIANLTEEQINQIVKQIGASKEPLSLENKQQLEWTKGLAANEVAKVDARNRAHMAKVGSKEHRFPQMLYRAQQLESGKWICMKPLPNDRDQAARGDAENFNHSCTLTVNDETERDRALAGEWAVSAQDAVAKALGQLRANSQEAGERNYRDRLMSEPAKAEVLAYERENFGHQPEIPEAKIVKRRGRPRKVNPEAN